MEQSAFEALMIGVNVFVFIIALTAGVLLMSNVIDMVNFANDQAIVGMNGTLAESIGIVTERTYTGTQMLRYYKEVTKKTINAEGEIIIQNDSPYNFKVTFDGSPRSIENFIQNEAASNYLNKNFALGYQGIQNGKHTYVFSLVVEQENEL